MTTKTRKFSPLRKIDYLAEIGSVEIRFFNVKFSNLAVLTANIFLSINFLWPLTKQVKKKILSKV